MAWTMKNLALLGDILRVYSLFFYVLTYFLILPLPISASEPVIHWRMELNGKDSQGNADIPAFTSTSFSKDCVEGSYALSFNSSKKSKVILSTYATSHDHFTQKPYTERTISLWFKDQKSSNESEQCLYKSGTEKTGFVLYLLKGSLHVSVMNNEDPKTAEEKHLQTTYKSNQWNHAVCRFNQGKIELFLNGEKVAEDTLTKHKKIPSALGSSSLGMVLGKTIFSKKTSNSYHYHGLMDDIKFYNTAVDNSEIKKLFQHSKTVKANTPNPEKKSTSIAQKSNTSNMLEPSIASNNKTKQVTQKKVRPVIYWRFEGNGKDAMGNESIHKFYKTSYSDDCIEGSKALLIDNSVRGGVTINQANKKSQKFTQQEFEQRTISLWFKALTPKEHTNKEQCLLKLGNNNRGLLLYLSEKKIYAKVFSSAKTKPLTINKVSSPYTLNRWTHVALRFYKGKLTLFVDGKEMSQNTFKNITKISTAGTGASLGALLGKSIIPQYKPNGNAFNGLMDSVKMFDIALSNKSIIGLYNQHSKIANHRNQSIDKPNPKALIATKQPAKIKNSNKTKARKESSIKKKDSPANTTQDLDQIILKVSLPPIIQWRFEGNGEDVFEHTHIQNFHKTTFSDDAIEGAKSLSFDSSQKSCVLIYPLNKTPNHFTQKEYTERTVSLWFKPLATEQESHLKQCLIKMGDIQGGLFIYLLDGKLHANIVNASLKGPLVKKLQVSYKTNKWNHVALTFFKGEATLYLNGEMADQGVFPQMVKINATTGGASLGAVHGRTLFEKESPHSQPYHGLIDNVQIFDISLDDTNIVRLSENKEALSKKDLVFAEDSVAKFEAYEPAQSQSSENLVQGKRYYVGVGIFALGIIGIFLGLILMFKKSLHTYDQYDSYTSSHK